MGSRAGGSDRRGRRVLVLAGSRSGNSGAPTATGARQQSPGGGRPGRFGAALAPVQAATATSEAVPRYLSGLGTVTAANTVTVRSRVDGQLLAIHFTEGQQVKAGDLLAEIDPSQFKVALARGRGATGQRSGDPRQRPPRSGALSAAGENQSGVAPGAGYQQSLVSETQGTIKADEAAVASAQLQLNWSRITAPIDGRVGLKQVDIGNQISSGDTTGIVVLTQTHPIDVVFTLPENQIATVIQAQKAGKKLVVEASGPHQ